VIGPGGKMIRSIQSDTGADIEIEDDGTVKISGPNEESVQKALRMVEGLTARPEVGKTYDGKVVGLKDFGAFVELTPGVEGLVHISELSRDRVRAGNARAVVVNAGVANVAMGAQGRRDAAEMARCHVFCLPSVRESGGAVLLEAMACARPVIAVGFGGPAEIVDDAVGSRPAAQRDRELALARMAHAGCIVAGTETVLFEWTRFANDERFRAVLALVKGF